MNSSTSGMIFAFAVCCGWPLLFHFSMLYGMRYIATRDWNNIQWQSIKFPWSKDE